MIETDLCFLEGQRGNCGPDCKAFLNGDCEVADEIEALIKSDQKNSGKIWDNVESQVMKF